MKAYVVLFCMILISTPAWCSGTVVLRDSEIENVIKKISEPLFRSAKVDTDTVKVFLVDDNLVNAFVTANNHIFIHKGLLRFSKDPEVVAGVIAHEIGHMSQYHIVKRASERRSGVLAESLGYILGMVAMVAVDPKIGQAIIAGSSTISQRRFLAYSRAQEEIADQFALEYLDAAGYSHEGLLRVLRHFGKSEQQYAHLDEYLLTHPLSEQRLRKLYNYSRKKEVVGFSAEDRENFARIVEKVEAFLMPLDTLKNRKLSQYMQSILDYREANTKDALEKLGHLIDLSPADPYLREIRAQILYKLGDIDSCILDYKAALAYLPNDMLIKLELAQAFLLKDPGEALPYLEQVTRQERDDPFVWKQLSLVYGRLGRIGMYYYALANRHFFEGNSREFLQYAQLSREHLAEGSFQLQIIADLEEAHRTR
ncbi:M48 family metalloprotease [Candidatus Anaplasma sp. TIGMIC]|uniref:M48 family metalloprotease n=1 Tax=Candidatus Anaplasma sp. TIGMIC TaxID=3020713 RepID=UPI00232A9B95|nr:M48 family metalloprotease [Candidatus Anaplasma sp. TIGMIC]MDB1135768.1 M48 family metalloprotease [Candidatus Anaplasma sp. TIGMIC]